MNTSDVPEMESSPEGSPIETPSVDDRYVLRMRRDVLPVLRKLANQPIAMELQIEQLGATFSSTLIAVNPDFEELVFDASGLPDADRLDGSAGLKAEVQMDAIWFRFESGHVAAVSGYGKPAFRAHIPRELTRLQRRNSDRFQVPVLSPPIVSIRFAGEEDAASLRAIDISCSGIALLVEDPHLPLELGRTFSDCMLHLPDIGGVKTELAVVYLANSVEGETRRVGCRFTNLQATALDHLQHYILRLEHAQQDSLTDI